MYRRSKKYQLLRARIAASVAARERKRIQAASDDDFELDLPELRKKIENTESLNILSTLYLVPNVLAELVPFRQGWVCKVGCLPDHPQSFHDRCGADISFCRKRNNLIKA